MLKHMDDTTETQTRHRDTERQFRLSVSSVWTDTTEWTEETEWTGGVYPLWCG